MSERTYRKILSYIDDDDLPKVKSYLKKHEKKIDLDHELDEEGNAALHIACKKGHDVISSYLIKRGASVWMKNKAGDLPIHEACFYATFCGRSHVYEDLLVPLIRADSSTLERENAQGFSPRMLLKDWETQLPKPFSDFKYTPSREDTSDSSSESEPAQESWSEKLARAMDDDYCGGAGGDYEDYHEDHSDTETWDDWASRMYSEHRNLRGPQYPQPGTSRKRPHQQHATRGRPKHPRISAEKRREFERKQKLEAQEEMAKRARVSAEKLVRRKHEYEAACARIFKQELGDAVQLGFTDIPWPETAGKGHEESTFDLLFCDLRRTEPEYKRYLREQVVRWHPDKFLQRLGAKLLPSDKERILDKVNAISQMLNQHSDQL